MGLTFDSKAFEVSLKEIDKKFDREARARVNNHLKLVMGYVVPLTPEGQYKRTARGKRVGGRLRGGWQMIAAKKTRMRGSYTGYLINNVEYAIHVEHDHRTRLGVGKYEGTYRDKRTGKMVTRKWKPKKDGKAYVKGAYMLERAVNKAKRKEGIG